MPALPLPAATADGEEAATKTDRRAPFSRRALLSDCAPRNMCPTAPRRRLACFLRLSILCIASLLIGGCVQTAMLPAQQLDAGTTVAGASLDEPGILYIPRANVQLTQGLGGGDLSVNLSGPPLGAGLTGRAYLSGRASAELQVQAAALEDAFDAGGAPTTGLALLGVQEVPTGEDRWYFGGQAGVIHGTGIRVGGPADVQTLPVVGASLGLGSFDLGSSWQIQVELASNVPVPVGNADDDDPPLPATRLSVGVFRLFD